MFFSLSSTSSKSDQFLGRHFFRGLLIYNIVRSLVYRVYVGAKSKYVCGGGGVVVLSVCMCRLRDILVEHLKKKRQTLNYKILTAVFGLVVLRVWGYS